MNKSFDGSGPSLPIVSIYEYALKGYFSTNFDRHDVIQKPAAYRWAVKVFYLKIKSLIGPVNLKTHSPGLQTDYFGAVTCIWVNRKNGTNGNESKSKSMESLTALLCFVWNEGLTEQTNQPVVCSTWDKQPLQFVFLCLTTEAKHNSAY